MSRFLRVMVFGFLPIIAAAPAVMAKPQSAAPPAGPVALSQGATAAKPDALPQQVEVTADESLEWYQDQHMYVARGNAKAVRGDMVVEADLLSAHEREPPPGQTANANGTNGAKAPKAPKTPDTSGAGKTDDGSSSIDRMIADGHVVITDPRERVLGDHAIDDLDKHVSVVTGNNLRYETEKETVTARDSLEYWDEKHIAVARGNAVAVGSDRHVEGDVLTAEFRLGPSGQQELWKMTADGHVIVITKTDVSRGDKAVYDINRDIAVISGHVLITRADGTQLAGDVGEVDFKTNQSRLLNEGHGRVRALLTPKATGKATGGADNTGKAAKPPAPVVKDGT